MLVVAVLWATLPAGVCLAQSQPVERHLCCRGMARTCGMRGMGVSGSCCRMERRRPEAAPATGQIPGQSQRAVLGTVEAAVLALASRNCGYAQTPEAVVVKSPPGTISILRI